MTANARSDEGNLQLRRVGCLFRCLGSDPKHGEEGKPSKSGTQHAEFGWEYVISGPFDPLFIFYLFHDLRNSMNLFENLEKFLNNRVRSLLGTPELPSRPAGTWQLSRLLTSKWTTDLGILVTIPYLYKLKSLFRDNLSGPFGPRASAHISQGLSAPGLRPLFLSPFRGTLSQF